jgi:uncharacterized protein YuzE
MEKNFEISYDKVEDIFYLGKEGKTKFSVDLALPSGDVVIDIGFDGLVIGAEIFNATQFFSLVKEELEKIRNAEFKMVYSPSYVSVTISILTKGGVVKNSLIVPYNKKLILAR